MKVLFLRSNPVDPDSRVEKEVDALIKNGYEVDILAWDRSSSYEIKKTNLNLVSGKVDIYRLGIVASFGGGMKKNFLPLLLFQYRMYKWLKVHIGEYDIIHACDFDTAFTAYLISRKYKKEMIYDIFDYYVDSFRVPAFLKLIIEKLDKIIINNSSAVIICTKNRMEQIRNTQPRKLYIIENTPVYYGEHSIKRVPLKSSKIKIVYVGILQDGRFIKEIAEFVINNTDYEFHVGGFGKYDSYFEDISIKYENIFFYGKLPYKKTLELENSCDLMVAIYDPNIRNHKFAAPNKFYEALMLGKPLIMIKDTGMSDIVERYDIGKVIEYNEQSFKNGIEILAKRKDEWESMSTRMKELYMNHYNWDEMEKKLCSCYASVLKKNI